MNVLDEMSKAKITIDIRNDGVFLTINMHQNAIQPTLKEVLDLIEQYGIQGVDSKEVARLVKNPREIVTVKISSSSESKSADEVAYITFEDFNMKAYITFSPPINKGKVFDKNDIYNFLETSGVSHGILDDVINQLCETHEFHQKYLVAVGTEKEDGRDGYVDFFFNTKKKSLTPKELENGQVDYRDLGLIEQTSAGDSLLTIVSPTYGKNGKDVKGNIVHAKAGKLVEKIIPGKNISMSEDKKSFYSEIDGQIDYTNRKISILPVLEVKGDVGHSTGNIDFNGSVIIKGMVPSNFVVKAKGNIEVYGIVEGAYIESDADVFLYSGVMGNEKGIIVAGGDVTAKFIDSCKVNVNGSITTRSVMHSEVTADGSLTVTGTKAVIVGGRACIGREVDATIIGSIMETRTEIIVGNTPAMLEKYRVLLEEQEKLKHKLNKTEVVIKTLNATQEEISEEKRRLLLKSFHTKLYLTAEKGKIDKEILELLPKLENKKGKVGASEIIYPGVYIAIGSARMRVDDNIRAANLVNRDGEMKIQSYY
ncbi:MAG: DUF342 domain-containing protein [Lachnospirales bacterium]